MVRKTRSKRSAKARKSIDVDRSAIRTLRLVDDEEAFYFCEGIGKPTGERAKSLSEFLEKVKSVKLESLVFHIQRRDFQNWIKKSLGDSKLAKRLGRIQPALSESLRTKIETTIEKRINELEEESTELEMMVDGDWRIAARTHAQ